MNNCVITTLIIYQWEGMNFVVFELKFTLHVLTHGNDGVNSDTCMLVLFEIANIENVFSTVVYIYILLIRP